MYIKRRRWAKDSLKLAFFYLPIQETTASNLASDAF